MIPSTPSLVELLEGTPEASLLSREVWEQVPSSLRPHYWTQASHLARAWVDGGLDDLSAFRAVHALAWEVECLLKLVGEGYPMNSKSFQFKHAKVAYPRYLKGQGLHMPPQAPGDRVRMENDVPLWDPSSNRPRWVETKSMFFRPYGQSFRAGEEDSLDHGALNQLLKYQLALDKGWVSSVSLVIRGRIHPLMWDWLTQGLDGHGPRAPGIEVVWSMPLPSGHDAWVSVKQGQDAVLGAPPSPKTLQDRRALEAFGEMSRSPEALRLLIQGGPGAWASPRCETLDQARACVETWRAQALETLLSASRPRRAPAP